MGGVFVQNVPLIANCVSNKHYKIFYLSKITSIKRILFETSCNTAKTNMAIESYSKTK